MLVEHLGVETPQLTEQDVVFPGDIFAVGRYGEEEQRVPLDVPQEAEAEAFALAGTLDDAGNVGHDERLVVTIGHDAQAWLHGSERVVGYLRACGRDCAEQGGLARVGEAHQSHVGQQFQFEDDGHFLHRFAGLCKAWRLARGGAEVPVAQASAAALEQDDFLAVLGDVTQVLPRLGIVGHCAAGHFDDSVFAVLAKAAVLRAALAVPGQDVPLVAQVQQGPVVSVSPEDDVPSLAPVAPVRPAVGLVFGPAHVCGAPASLARAAIDFHVVYKVRIGHGDIYVMV